MTRLRLHLFLRWSDPRAVAVCLVFALGMPSFASSQISVDKSYFVPQAGPIETPSEAEVATRWFRFCPNNDGGSSLPHNARIKIVLRDATNTGIPGVPADQICIVLNGGTAVQGFGGVGADSIIANSVWNLVPLCPDVRCIPADAPTDASGVTYITFGGADPSNPGVYVRDPSRKWGHYDTELPVYAMGVRLLGRRLTDGPSDTYRLQIKCMDHVGGLGTIKNAGMVVSSLDYNSVLAGLSFSEPTNYWRDLDGSGSVSSPDLNMVVAHMNHDCDTPNSP